MIPGIYSRASPTATSPGAPVTQAITCCGAACGCTLGVTAEATRPRIGCCSFALVRHAWSAATRSSWRCLCLSDRLAASRVTDPPAVPREIGGGVDSANDCSGTGAAGFERLRQTAQVTVLAVESHAARVPVASDVPHWEQVSSRRRDMSFMRWLSAAMLAHRGSPKLVVTYDASPGLGKECICGK